MNNLYIVISEELSRIEPLLDDGSGPTEYYRIIELVIARNHSQARIAAAQHGDDDYRGRVQEIPRMTIRLLDKGLPLPQGTIVTLWTTFEHWWSRPQVLAALDAAPS